MTGKNEFEPVYSNRDRCAQRVSAP